MTAYEASRRTRPAFAVYTNALHPPKIPLRVTLEVSKRLLHSSAGHLLLALKALCVDFKQRTLRRF